MFSLLINDVDISKYINISNVNKKLFASVDNSFLSYSQISGSRLRISRQESREITIDFWIDKDVQKNIDLLKRAIPFGRILDVVFSDEPDRIYYCVLNGGSDFEKKTRHYATGQFTLLCLDGVAYSKKEKKADVIGKTLKFINNGTGITYPKFSFTTTSNLTLFGLSHPNGKAIQMSRNGEVVISSGDKVIIDTKTRIVTINNKRAYLTPASEWFGIDVGKTEIGVLVNSGANTPVIFATFREVFQ